MDSLGTGLLTVALALAGLILAAMGWSVMYPHRSIWPPRPHRGQLKTDGFYRFSRNPQYIADIAILIGLAFLCASMIAIPAIVAGILLLLIAPFVEESWLEEQYGQAYRDYKATVRRYL